MKVFFYNAHLRDLLIHNKWERNHWGLHQTQTTISQLGTKTKFYLERILRNKYRISIYYRV